MEHIHISNQLKTLINLGLSEKEALIYLASLKTGGSSITELARSADIERTGVYYHIDKLLNLNLLKITTRGKRSYFIAADPLSLKKILNKKQKELENVLPSMHKLYMRQTSQSIVESFQGKGEVNDFYDRFYEILVDLQTKEKKTVYSLGHSYNSAVSSHKELSSYKKPANQLDIKVKAILPSSQRSNEKRANTADPYIVTRYSLPPAELKYIRDKNSYPSPIMIAGDFVAVVDYSNFIFSITENRNLAETWRFFFNHLWCAIK